MIRMALWIVQLNSQMTSAVMSDLSLVLMSERVNFALLQELYVPKERVCGLLSTWRVYVCGRVTAKAAVVVCDESVEAFCVNECTEECGVCVWLRGIFGEMFVASMYCRHVYDIRPYLAYMDRVRECVKGERMIIGMDANAASPLWFSKDGGRSRENEMRGRILEEWLVATGITLLNEPSEFYTFSEVRGQSDVDVTLVQGNMAGCLYKWEVKSEWYLSGHNTILIQMMYESANKVRKLNVWRRWICENVSWEDYERDLSAIADERGMDVICESNVEKIVERVTERIQEVNIKYMKVRVNENDRRIRWWTN